VLKQLLRHGRIFREGKTAWTKLYRAWLARQRLGYSSVISSTAGTSPCLGTGTPGGW
jgi:hypothetical protein